MKKSFNMGSHMRDLQARHPEIVVSANRLAAFFGWAVAALVLAHAVVQFARFASGDERLYGLLAALSLGGERNAPALYSTFALFFSAVLLAAIAMLSVRDRRYWWVLAAVFVFLGLDEFLEIHEKLIVPVRGALHVGGAFYFAWIIPYGVGATLFGLAYLRFLGRLPRRTAVLFVLAGAIFVTGAIGMEMIGGVFADKEGTRQVGYVLEQTLEEVLEMSGIVLFIYALGDYLVNELGGLTLRLGNRAPAPRTSVRHVPVATDAVSEDSRPAIPTVRFASLPPRGGGGVPRVE